MEFVTVPEMALRVVLAGVFGGVLGWERETQRKPAGLRTHMMVSLGAAVFTIGCLELHAAVAREAGPGRPANADPIRAVEAVVGALGFLGAGTIIQARGSVEGVTTAATMWVTGGIGLACGAGLYPLAVTALVAAFIVLTALARFERRYVRPDGAGRDAAVGPDAAPEPGRSQP